MEAILALVGAVLGAVLTVVVASWRRRRFRGGSAMITLQQRLNPVLTSGDGDPGSVINHQPERTKGVLLNEEANSLQQYFHKLKVSAQKEGFPKVRLVQEAENVWLDLKKRFGNQLPEPQAALALDGSLMFTWRRPGHYLEIEVFPDGHKEAFYENEITGTPWEAKITPSASITDRVLEKLSIFMLDKVHLN